MKGLLLFLSCIVSATALGTSAPSRANDLAYFNYAGANDKKTVSGGDLIKKLIPGEVISTYEEQYLNEKNYSLVYSGLPSSNNLVSFAELGGEMYAEAKPYSYKSNSVTYTWLPSSLEIGNSSTPFDYNENSKQYIAHASYSGATNVSVKYKIGFNLNEEKVNNLLNSAYLEGKEVGEYDESVDAYQQYLLDLQEYREKIVEYNAYKSVVDAYDEYLAELAKYNEDYQKYLQYLNDVATFEDRVAAYNNYLLELDKYNKNKDVNQKEYDAYIESLQYVTYQLDAMKILYTDFTIEDVTRNANDLIMGETVTTVLNAKEDLVKLANVPEQTVDEAYNASCNMRIFLQAYKKLTTDSARYDYYFHYYNFIRKQTEMLLRCLDKLYRSGSVPTIIESKGKMKQYTLLMAILAYFCNAIDDFSIYNYEGYNKATDNGSLSKPGAAIIDEKWTFAGKTFSQWLGNNLLDTTKTGEPKNGKYPSEAVELLVPPTPVEKPVYPTEVSKPVAPTEPTNPNTLTPVEKPIYPTEVAEPEEKEYTELQHNLGRAYNSGALHEREIPSNLKVEFEESISKNTSNSKHVAVFHDEHNNIIYYSFYNTGATFVGEEPYKPGDSTYVSYSTVWVDDDNNVVDLETLSTSANLYPTFVGNDRNQYVITFVNNFGDVLKVLRILSGDTPTFNGTPSKEDINKDGKNYYYDFDHWDKEFVPAYENTTYTAYMVEKPYLIVSYVVNNETYLINEYKYGEYASHPEEFPGTYERNGVRFVFNNWDYDFNEPITKDVVVKAIFDESAYSITFDVNGKRSIQWTTKGEVPVYNGTPTKESTYSTTYTFRGWARTPNGQILSKLPAATSPTVYYAVFSESSIVTAENGNVRINDSDSVTVDSSSVADNAINVGNLMEKVRKTAAKPVQFMFNNASINFSEAQIEALAQRGLTSFKFEKEADENNNIKTRLLLKDDKGQEINEPSIQPTITLYNVKQADHYQISVDGQEVASTLSGSNITYKSKLNTIYDLTIYYKVRINYFDDNDESGSAGVNNIKVDKATALPGERINVTYQIAEGHHKYSAYALFVDSDFEQPLDENNSFVMPDEDVIIFIKAVKNNYRLRFYVDDMVIYELSGNLGDLIELPTKVSKANDEEYQYIFIGWDDDSNVVTGDKDYHAKFDKIPLEFVNPNQGGGKNYSALIGIAILIGSILLLGVGVFILIKFFNKRNQKSK